MDDDALAREFGLGMFTRTGVTARGEMGEVWQVVAPAGTFALKRIFEPVDESDVEEEVEFTSAARAAGVPAPEIVRTVDGGVLVDGRWRMFGWVDLCDVDITIDPAAVGATVAAAHRADFVGERSEHWWYTDPVGPARWGELARSAAPWADRLDALRADLVELESWLRPARTLRTCHRDLWADNVRTTAGGGVCVIDWDNCGLADPSQELALVLVEFAADDVARARTLIDAYADAGGPGRLVDRGDFSMVIAQLGHLGERALTMWLEAEPGTPQRDRAEMRVEEFLSRPLTVALAERLLDVATGG